MWYAHRGGPATVRATCSGLQELKFDSSPPQPCAPNRGPLSLMPRTEQNKPPIAGQGTAIPSEAPAADVPLPPFAVELVNCMTLSLRAELRKQPFWTFPVREAALTLLTRSDSRAASSANISELATGWTHFEVCRVNGLQNGRSSCAYHSFRPYFLSLG